MKNIKKFLMNVSAVTLIISALALTGCASKKGEISELDDEAFKSKIILVASGSQRLVKFEMPDNQILPDVDAKAIQAASLNLEIYSGRKPKSGGKDGTPVVTLSFDLVKEADKLINGFDLMTAEKITKVSAEKLNEALSKNQYYYAKGSFEATAKQDKLVTKTKTLYSNDTVYTPLQDE